MGGQIQLYFRFVTPLKVPSILDPSKKKGKQKWLKWRIWTESNKIKVLINVWNCIFKSSQWIGQCYTGSWELIPFRRVPKVKIVSNHCEHIICSATNLIIRSKVEPVLRSLRMVARPSAVVHCIDRSQPYAIILNIKATRKKSPP